MTPEKNETSQEATTLRKGILGFRSSNEVESFYRFINDNSLRREARIMLNLVYRNIVIGKKRKAKSKKIQ